MKLQRQGRVEQEGLVDARIGTVQRRSVLREGEGLTVPVKGAKALRQRRIAAGKRRSHTLNVEPADLADRIGADFTPEGLGDQLTAKTVPEHGQSPSLSLTHQVQHRLDPGQRVIYAHGSAHEHQTGGAVYTLGNRFTRVDGHQAALESPPIEKVLQVTRTFIGDKAKNHYF